MAALRLPSWPLANSRAAARRSAAGTPVTASMASGELTGRATNSRHSLNDLGSQRAATKASSTSPSVTITCAMALMTATLVPGLSLR